MAIFANIEAPASLSHDSALFSAVKKLPKCSDWEGKRGKRVNWHFHTFVWLKVGAATSKPYAPGLVRQLQIPNCI